MSKIAWPILERARVGGPGTDDFDEIIQVGKCKRKEILCGDEDSGEIKKEIQRRCKGATGLYEPQNRYSSIRAI